MSQRYQDLIVDVSDWQVTFQATEQGLIFPVRTIRQADRVITNYHDLPEAIKTETMRQARQQFDNHRLPQQS